MPSETPTFQNVKPRNVTPKKLSEAANLLKMPPLEADLCRKPSKMPPSKTEYKVCRDRNPYAADVKLTTMHGSSRCNTKAAATLKTTGVAPCSTPTLDNNPPMAPSPSLLPLLRPPLTPWPRCFRRGQTPRLPNKNTTVNENQSRAGTSATYGGTSMPVAALPMVDEISTPTRTSLGGECTAAVHWNRCGPREQNDEEGGKWGEETDWRLKWSGCGSYCVSCRWWVTRKFTPDHVPANCSGKLTCHLAKL